MVCRTIGTGHSTASLYEDSDPVVLSTSAHAIGQAYKDAGITVANVNIAEVHDCFTVTELLMYEAMGMCDIGKAGHLLREGVTDIGGRLPVNTGGGLVGFGHPVGATGVKQSIEIWRQMKGVAGGYQVPGAPGVGLSVNMGGDDRTVVVGVYKNQG